MLKLGILISGRGSNMRALVKASQSGKINATPAVVIADRDARGIAVAKALGVDTRIVDADPKATRAAYDRRIESSLRDFGVTPRGGLVCLAGFMRILGPEFVSKYKNRILNVHPALLPAFSGLSAQRQAIEYGVRVTGCTVHFVDPGVDTGPIITQRAVRVRDGDTTSTLSERILAQEHRAYVEAVSMVADGRVRVRGNRVVRRA